MHQKCYKTEEKAPTPLSPLTAVAVSSEVHNPQVIGFIIPDMLLVVIKVRLLHMHFTRADVIVVQERPRLVYGLHQKLLEEIRCIVLLWQGFAQALQWILPKQEGRPKLQQQQSA